MSLIRAVEDLKSCLRLGSSHQDDHMFESLQSFINEESISRMLLGSQQGLLDLDNLSTFIIRSRQVIDRQCRNLIEKVIFYLFCSIPKDSRRDAIHQIDKIIKSKTASNSKNVSKVLLLDFYSPPDRAELGVKDKQYFPEIFRLLPEHGDQYEDFELTEKEVQRIFNELDVLVSQSAEPRFESIKLFNDFLVRSCFNLGFNFTSD